jgi:hypothetical protein
MILFAFTAAVAAMAAFWAAYGTAITAGLAIAGTLSMVAGAGVSIYSGHQANAAAKTAASQQQAASQAAAQAQQMAANAQAEQLKDKAELATLQASIENKKAGVAQEKGEIEEQRRMAQLSYDIGNAYAAWAGNGLLVDGGADSFGSLLTANTREAGQDVGIIKANTANEVWEHEQNATSHLLTAKSYESQAGYSSLTGQVNANATLMAGEAQAYATRQQGLTALYSGYGSALQMLGSAAFGAANFWGGSATGTIAAGAKTGLSTTIRQEVAPTGAASYFRPTP